MHYRMPTVALNIGNLDSIPVASRFREKGIVAAGGMQCAPLAHKSLETAPQGVVRFSFGPTTTQEDVEVAVDALVAIAESVDSSA